MKLKLKKKYIKVLIINKMKGKANGGGTQIVRPQVRNKQKGKNQTQNSTKS